MSGLNLEPIDPGQDPASGAAVEPDPDGVLAKIRRQRAHLEQQLTEDFELPGYNGLIARYRRLPAEKTREILNLPDTGPTEVNAQLLIDACEEILFRDDAGDTHVSFGYDDDLADALEIRASTARETVLAVFGGAEQVMCVHGMAVYAWMLNLRRADDEALLGESKGTRT